MRQMRGAIVSGLLKDPTRGSGVGLGWGGLEVGRRNGGATGQGYSAWKQGGHLRPESV